MLVKWPPLNIVVQIVVYMLLLFAGCMICHSELYRLRPHPRFLSAFYLMIAVGGAIGGIYVNLIAPHLFSTGFWELQWGLVACGVLLAIVMNTERTVAPPVPQKGRRQDRRSKSHHEGERTRRGFKPAVILTFLLVLLLGGSIVAIMQSISSGALLATRSFYGVSRVWELNSDEPKLRAYQLTHGKTAHGFQFADDTLSILPTAFYADSSGVGLALNNHPSRPGNLRVGALGLGIGVIAGYGERGDIFRFYEINPDVIQLAQGGGGYFSFLSDSRADVSVIPGDARVSLENELVTDGPQNFDLLVLDTFNGDAMPVHLLTKEALEIYLKHLKSDGIIAINVSNRYFDLDKEVYKLADELGLSAVLIEDRGDGIRSYDSVWMLLTRNRSFLGQPAIAARAAQRPDIPARLRVWTDEFSNLLQILRRPSAS
jgi:hypothetical protein